MIRTLCQWWTFNHARWTENRTNQAFDVVVDASDDTEVARVDVQLNGQLVATSNTPSQGDTYTITVPAQVDQPWRLLPTLLKVRVRRQRQFFSDYR
ncbi:Ig-like domain-containing protein [Vibrio chagasii]|nr:Ig-like domain-containing protein [Vibrio chagasii]